MLLHILNRIENMLKYKAQAAGPEAPFAGPADTHVAVEVDARNLNSAVSTRPAPDLLYLLNVIRANAEFLEVIYGDSLAIKNIKAATEKASETARSINTTRNSEIEP